MHGEVLVWGQDLRGLREEPWVAFPLAIVISVLLETDKYWHLLPT